ncbi:hypothetical protein [Kitasatospora sp. NPDC093806]|uniref:hypothetical protein n=1 Tax=Kitasatospora sp. NPDC093806 TaxID=3155075 RepID=UPI003440B2DE
MLGWWIVISAPDPQRPDRPTADTRGSVVLAKWEAGLGGLDWLSGLVEAGKAEQLSHNGYPNRYTARAGDVLPLLAGGTVPDTGWGAAHRPRDLYADRMAVCPPDRSLTIEAWDQS